MSTSKHIDKICIAVIIITLVITILFMNGEKLGITVENKSMGYETRIFDNSKVHEIDIVMDDWDDFIENCEDEEYNDCTVVIDGEKYKNIGIRAKGNTSLSQVKQMNSQRYSFKIEFDQYDSKKTYYGLDKLCLNNLIQDNTMMKDYLVYQMMNEFGADSPLCSYVYITVNGEDWGLYLAVEGVEDSFLERNYDSEGELYKPDSQSNGGGRGNGKDFDMDDRMAEIEEENQTDENATETTPSTTPDTNNNQQNGNTGVKVTKTADNTQASGGNAMGGNNAGGNANGNTTGGTMPQMPGGNTNGNNGSNNGGTMPQMPGGNTNGGTMPQMPGGNSSNFPQMPGGDSTVGETEGTDGSSQGTEGSSEEKSFDFSSFFKNNMSNFGGGMGSDDVKLKYIDDNSTSYSNIFDNAKTDITESDKSRLISSLKSLSEYSDIENILDVDEVLRYFVVHNFVCNGDSYTGSMVHNYYLYENDGKLSMIPWDYNLAFGTFQGGNASSTINTSIDSPVSNGTVDDRPMVGWIFSNEEYTSEYHTLFADFIENFITNGKMEEMINSTADMIREYVEKDPTKFCTIEDFESGVDTIKQYMSLRGEAVSRQLSGNTEAVDTGNLNLSLMGTMGSTMGGGNDKMNFGGFTDNSANNDANSDANGTQATPPADGSGAQATPPADGNGSGTQATPPADGNGSGTQATPPTDGNTNGTQATPPTDGNTNGTQATPPTDGNGSGAQATPPADGNTNGTQATPPTDESGNGENTNGTQGSFNPFENGGQFENNGEKDNSAFKDNSKTTSSNATVKTLLISSGISLVVLIFGIIFAIKKKY